MSGANVFYIYKADGEYSHQVVSMGLTPSDPNFTGIAPEYVAGFRPVWGGEAWTQVEDHRGRMIYGPDGAEQKVTELGPVPDGWSPEPPAMPGPSEEQEQESQIMFLKGQLAALDHRYLTPRVLAGLAKGDEYAEAQWAEHEELAGPIREQIKALQEG
jgi:hypothetical protein